MHGIHFGYQAQPGPSFVISLKIDETNFSVDDCFIEAIFFIFIYCHIVTLIRKQDIQITLFLALIIDKLKKSESMSNRNCVVHVWRTDAKMIAELR